MTRDQALALARAKWGRGAYARYQYGYGCIVGNNSSPYEAVLAVDYTGATWEEACKNAGLLP